MCNNGVSTVDPRKVGVISEEQRALNRALHERNSNFGNRDDGAGFAGDQLTKALMRMHELGICNSFLDYGTGKGKLVQKLRSQINSGIKITGYDPAVEEWENKPNEASDILSCLDVLEHIEHSSIDDVLKDIHNLTRRFCYLVIDLQPAVKKLEDGRNAHILLAPTDWWIGKIAQHFTCQASFPVFHNRGIAQKLVVAGAHNANDLPFMYGFLNKLKLYDMTMAGGTLGTIKKKKKQQNEA